MKALFCLFAMTLIVGVRAHAQEVNVSDELSSQQKYSSVDDENVNSDDIYRFGGHGGGGWHPGHGGPMPGHGPVPGHGGVPYPGGHWPPGHEHGHDPIHRGHIGGWQPRPGWHNTWHWDHGYRRPHWWHVGIRFPIFAWIPGMSHGFWQCTAYSEDMQAYSATGRDVELASYNALYDCGGPNAEDRGCYIPEGYCNYYR
ncbi:MAG TPA: hypothetical protein VF412_04205 [Bdellovibrio sp.]|uniref:hypothetical protein n=1 Tax=Bdellovibrio sp. TaxID=28201 RepID=UPI002EF1E70B